MNSHEQDFWPNGKGSPLAFLLPGGTGTKRPVMRGYDTIAAALWLRGYSVQIFSGPGQDGMPGHYSMKSCLAAACVCVKELIERLDPPTVVFLGSCAGGMLAAHLACSLDRPCLLVLWEAPMSFSDEDVAEFARRATQQGMSVAEDASSSVVDMEAIAEQVFCPVLVAWGDATQPPVFRGSQDLCMLRDRMKNAVIEEFFLAGADHNLTRGTSLSLLSTFIDAVIAFSVRHREDCAHHSENPQTKH